MKRTDLATCLSPADPHFELLRRLLAELPQDRFRSMDEVSNALTTLSTLEGSNDPLPARTWLAARAADLAQRP